jgi:hypothetical protein
MNLIKQEIGMIVILHTALAAYKLAYIIFSADKSRQELAPFYLTIGLQVAKTSQGLSLRLS